MCVYLYYSSAHLFYIVGGVFAQRPRIYIHSRYASEILYTSWNAFRSRYVHTLFSWAKCTMGTSTRIILRTTRAGRQLDLVAVVVAALLRCRSAACRCTLYSTLYIGIRTTRRRSYLFCRAVVEDPRSLCSLSSSVYSDFGLL